MEEIIPKHHAILIEGDTEDTSLSLLAHLKSSGDPDVIWIEFQSLGIDEAREIIESSTTAPVIAEKKKIIIKAEDITREAQNALLKLLEDPSPSVEFIILLENANLLLPTLLSRLHVVRSQGVKERDINTAKFIKSPISQRFELIEGMTKELKDSGSKSEIRKFLIAVQRELEKDPVGNAAALRAAANAVLYLDDKGSSAKLLLESVALAV